MNGFVYDLWDKARDLSRLAALGAIAGVIAAKATTLFQAAWVRAHLPTTGTALTDPPPTEKLANAVAEALTGKPLPKRHKQLFGTLVHYAMGAGLGATYVLSARRFPGVTAGHGTAFGLGVWATVEEIGLALVRLKPPPWRVEPAEHLFAAGSHLVFGLALGAAVASLTSPHLSGTVNLLGFEPLPRAGVAYALAGRLKPLRQNCMALCAL